MSVHPSDPTHPIPAPLASRAPSTVQWPEPPQDAVYQDAPYASAPVPPSGATRGRWSGRRTAVVAALALALTSVGALAAAAATPQGIAGPTEQRGGPGFQGRQPGQLGRLGPPGAGPGNGGQQPGGMPGQGRTHH